MDNGASSYRRFLEGDESAFDEILKTYRDHLVFFINRYVQDYAAAEDIAIDVFMQLIIHRHRYNFKTPLKTYLFVMGRSRALDFLRRRKRIQLEEWSDGADEPGDFSALEESLFADERKRVVNDALMKLPEEMRAAVHLVYFEQLTYEEAARVMKKNRKQVDNLLYRAKAELRRIIGEEGRLLI
ncbi:MAG: RNA polymerase sigma factor [Lachnospiraceae bacterium]|nr:RNA polymerase sigma factor [Lachnospiraceae bacterium]